MVKLLNSVCSFKMFRPLWLGGLIPNKISDVFDTYFISKVRSAKNLKIGLFDPKTGCDCLEESYEFCKTASDHLTKFLDLQFKCRGLALKLWANPHS